MRRRSVLGLAGAAMMASSAGCLDSAFETRFGNEPPVLEDRPNAVYVPTHQEGMEMIGMGMAGDLSISLMYSYPHRFWVIEQEESAFVARRIDIQRDDAIHLMATPFHRETGTVVPATGLSVEVMKDGSLVTQEAIYPMLSQQMGFHYGANFPLDGDGMYEVNVSVGGTQIARFGEFERLFEEPAQATIEFEYSESARNDISYDILDERAGELDAIEPMRMSMGMGMQMDEETETGTEMGMGDEAEMSMEGDAGTDMGMMPSGSAPDPLPGENIGETMSGDNRFVVQSISHGRFAGAGQHDSASEDGGDHHDETQTDESAHSHQTEGVGTYIVVSAQTPYNRLVVPGMGLDMTITSTGHGEERTLFDGRLQPALDPEFGFHYGGMVDHLHSGDEIELTVTTPPQVARHEGYETAFLNMEPMAFTVP
jgi:uncharacterized protein involved in high-affinity Fe2+ transport